jgi:hypothetical protein
LEHGDKAHQINDEINEKIKEKMKPLIDAMIDNAEADYNMQLKSMENKISKMSDDDPSKQKYQKILESMRSQEVKKSFIDKLKIE